MGRGEEPRRWPVHLSCLLIIICPRAPIRQLSAGRPDAEKPFSSCLCSKNWGFFRHIVILYPTIEHNKTYKQCPWLWADPEVYVLDPGERLHDYLWAFYLVFKGEPTLFIIDDCSATKALNKKRDMLSESAFSGRLADISVWVLTQKYNSVLTDLRGQTRWVALFHCKDRDSFEDCLR